MKGITQATELLLFRAVKFFICLLPRKICLLSGSILGLSFFLVDNKHRSLALSNLKRALGNELPLSSLRRISRNSFTHFVRAIFDSLKFSYLKEDMKTRLLKVKGDENLDEALQKGKGVLIFSAHYGSWEIAPFFLSKKSKISVIVRALDNSLLEEEVLELRRSLGTNVIYKNKASRGILKSLKAKEMVCILIDQNVLRSHAVFVDFFGKKAASSPGLATFHMRTGAPIVPAFCYPTASQTYILEILPPVEIQPDKDFTLNVLKITQKCNKIIENQIRKKPDYWLWFHDRWKTRPEGEI